MDISHLITQTGSVAASAAKATGGTGTTKLATQGNFMPMLENVHEEHKQAETPQNVNSQVNTEQLHHFVNQANEVLKGHFSDLKFTVSEGTDINVVRVEDSETGELIRQFPSEAMVAIARALEESQPGLMIEEKA